MMLALLIAGLALLLTLGIWLVCSIGLYLWCSKIGWLRDDKKTKGSPPKGLYQRLVRHLP